MSALQLEAPPRAVVPIPRAGRVVRWLVSINERVQAGQEIAIFDDGGGPIEITAPCTGSIVVMLMPGLPVNAGGDIAQIEPDKRPEPLKRAVPIAPPQHTPPAPKTPPAPSGEPTEASVEVPRRSTLGEEEALIAVEELSLPTPIKPTKRPRRPRVAKRTCHPTNHQIEEFKGLLEKLGKRGHDYSAGELERLAFHLLLSLPEQELVAAAEANRDREVAGRYGYGVGPRG